MSRKWDKHEHKPKAKNLWQCLEEVSPFPRCFPDWGDKGKESGMALQSASSRYPVHKIWVKYIKLIKINRVNQNWNQN